MSVPSKTIQADLLTLQSIAANAEVVGAAFDVSTLFAGMIYIDFAPLATTGGLTDGAETRIEVSELATGNAGWRSVVQFRHNANTAASTNITTGAVGATQLTVVSTANFTNNVIAFCYNAGTIANSEWVRVFSNDGGGGHVNVVDALTNLQSGNVLLNQAEQYQFRLDLTTVKRIRAVVNNNLGATERLIGVQVKLTTLDSVS